MRLLHWLHSFYNWAVVPPCPFAWLWGITQLELIALHYVVLWIYCVNSQSITSSNHSFIPFFQWFAFQSLAFKRFFLKAPLGNSVNFSPLQLQAVMETIQMKDTCRNCARRYTAPHLDLAQVNPTPISLPSNPGDFSLLESLWETFSSTNSSSESVHSLAPAEVSALHALGIRASHR